ncbi:MAG TPA: PKD domain-containing protein [Flavobacteriaceae bacterium]|nr:PKD domain-containing protein [Flavobacteriaceae bacterium]
MKYCLLFSAFLVSSIINAQSQTKRALFLGNSYTSVNNLPQTIADMAISTDDALVFDSNTPGGYTLHGHSTNATSLAKIAMGNWDFVVLQEQSQYPSFPIEQVETEVFPYAQILDSLINAQNPCAETVFYMTWGRKNGDASNCASWPPVCTYAGMDSLLNLRYRMMAENNDAILSPVGAVWKHIRQNLPEIELYQADNSHPSVAGTYAAACSFYTVLFRKDPTLITFNSTLSDTEAENIRTAAKLVVYDSLMNWHVGEYDPVADFTYQVSGDYEISFTNVSTNATNFYWEFGDGNTSTSENPIHVYPGPGSYTTSLMSDKCGVSDTIFETIDLAPLGISKVANSDIFSLYPNPATTTLTLTQNTSEKILYIITNLKGQAIQSGWFAQQEKQISTASFSDGIYFIQLFNGKKLLNQQKFIKSTF